MEKRDVRGRFQKGYDNRKNFPIIGDTYGDYTVISEETSYKGFTHVHFHVKCKCGKECFVRAGWLKNGRMQACKSCVSKRVYAESKASGKSIGFIKITHEGVGDITKTLYNHYKANAKVRDIPWNLTLEFLWELYLKQDKKCAVSGLDIWFTDKRKFANVNWELMNASLDRIDSNKGYEEGNMQWVHKEYNRFKNNYSMEKFLEMCKTVVEYHQGL